MPLMNDTRTGIEKIHVAGRRPLALLAVDPADDLQRAPVEAVPDRRPDRAEGVEPLGPAPLAVGLLQVAAGDVVDAHEPTDAPLGLGFRRPLEPACR